MSVLIKGMKMPKDCPLCPCAHWNKNDVMTGCEIVWRYVPDSETDYWQSDKRPKWCPLVEVPTPHGRLIDADELQKIECLFKDLNCFENFMYNHGVGDCIAIIRNAPTIIEAEKGEEE